jgi:hypothetical protein
MRTYVPPFYLCDDIMRLLAQTQTRTLTIASVQGSFAGNTDVDTSLRQLVKDGYVITYDSYYTLLPSGIQFISDDGYKAEFEREANAEKLEVQVHEASIRVAQSVEETNKATLENNDRIKKIMNRTLFASGASVIVALSSVVVSYIGQHQPKEQPKRDTVTVVLKWPPLADTGSKMLSGKNTGIDSSRMFDHKHRRVFSSDANSIKKP